MEAQQPVVETYYGPGQLPALLAQLQPEVDRQARHVLDGFAARRDVQRKVLAYCTWSRVAFGPEKGPDFWRVLLHSSMSEVSFAFGTFILC